MAESKLRSDKKRAQALSWSALSPAQRLERAADMTSAANAFRQAGLAYLGFSPAEISRIERSRAR